MKKLFRILSILILFSFLTVDLFCEVLTDTLQVSTKTFAQNTKDSTVFINIDFPQIENINNDSIITKVNKFLEEEFKQAIYWYDETIVDSAYLLEYAKEYPYSFETGYQVVFNTIDFISIVLNHYQFTGGAHGNYFAVGYNIDMQDGSVLTLNDILVEGSIDLLTYECEESILDTYQANTLLEAGLFENELKLSLDQDFYIINGAIVLQFDPYEIGPYSMGEILAEIPFEKIADILKDELPFVVK